MRRLALYQVASEADAYHPHASPVSFPHDPRLSPSVPKCASGPIEASLDMGFVGKISSVFFEIRKEHRHGYAIAAEMIGYEVELILPRMMPHRTHTRK